LNGAAAVLDALPVYGPCTWIDGLIVFTLVVTPGMGDWVAVTEPPCALRPESGSVAAWLP
jgi:hypothetical protein